MNEGRGVTELALNMRQKKWEQQRVNVEWLFNGIAINADHFLISMCPMIHGAEGCRHLISDCQAHGCNWTEKNASTITIACGMPPFSASVVRTRKLNMGYLCQCIQLYEEPLHYKYCQHRQQPWMELEWLPLCCSAPLSDSRVCFSVGTLSSSCSP